MAIPGENQRNGRRVKAFLDRIESPRKRDEAIPVYSRVHRGDRLARKLWGDSLIGFGSYHYKYKTGHEGDAMIVGFSPRKSKISLYLYADFPERESLLAQLGKHTAGVVLHLCEQVRRHSSGGVAGTDCSDGHFHPEQYPDP
jgi:hypothetical protein